MFFLNVKYRNCNSGMTLIELLIAMAIFSVLMGILYTSFSSVKNHVSELSDRQEMTKKGQRVLDYVGEELRLAGLFVGARPGITLCGVANTNSLLHTAGAATDSISFLTSERIRTSSLNNPFLVTTTSVAKGTNTLTVNAIASQVSAIVPSNSTTNNGRAFITFDTLQPNLGNLVYQVTDFSGNSMTISPPLDQVVNQFSNAYAVVWKQIEVNENRELRIVKREAACTATTGFNADTIIASHGAGNANGGVDGFHAEYVLSDGTAVAALLAQDIPRVRAIRLWLLIRSDFPAQSYRNTTTYTLGQASPVSISVNDAYRRLVLSKTVEVKNVGY